VKIILSTILLLSPALVSAGAILPQMPLGARFALTPEAKIPVNQGAIDVMTAYKSASSMLGQSALPVGEFFEFLLNVCLNEGLCDGAYIKGKPLPPPPKSQTISNEATCTNPAGCCTGGPVADGNNQYFGSASSCSYGRVINYEGSGDGQIFRITEYGMSQNQCIPAVNPNIYTQEGPVSGIMTGYSVTKYWGCYADQVNTLRIHESYVNFPLEVMDISQVSPGPASPAASNTATAYSVIAKAAALPGVSPVQAEVLNKGLAALGGITISGGNVAISAGVSSTSVTGVAASNSPSGNQSAPLHVLVDNMVIVKYQGDDQPLPTVTTTAKKIRQKTFASKYAQISALRSTTSVSGLLNKFQLPTSTATVQTNYCFETQMWGNHCIDLAASGIWPVIYMMRFFVVAAAFMAGYFVIFA
jgi:hypothetical protein